MKNFLAFSFLSLVTTGLVAVELPLREVTIFSSGVAFFEHEVEVSDSCNFELTFDYEQIDDFLKSLAISDGGAKKISLEYSSSSTVEKTLQSLAIDLSKRPSIYTILKEQIGSEVSFSVLQGVEKFSAEGRILSVDKSNPTDKNSSEQTIISVLTDEGVRVFNLQEVLSFKFTDSEKNKALIKALQLLDTENTSGNKRKININIEGLVKEL